MWYEIIPCVAIITTAITIPPVFNYVLHRLTQNGNPYRRNICVSNFDLRLYQRDLGLTGNVYVQKGLENIPE